MPPPEKIIFFIDLHDEMKKLVAPGISRLDMTKRALSALINIKSHMNKNHQYGLAILTEGAIMVHNFTSDGAALNDKIFQLQTQGQFNQFNMDSVIDILSTHVSAPQKQSPPDYVIRFIFIYGRPQVVPTWESMALKVPERFQIALGKPFFFFDWCFLYDGPQQETIEIAKFFSLLKKPSKQSDTYSFEMICPSDVKDHTTLLKFMTYFGLLTAHPLQRGDLGKHLCSFQNKEQGEESN